ncbi:MAG TPA: hypothetical protein VFY92_05020 [Hyphomicrobiaceae bacterium]|nr:hypothetical protein [Hyphomicrobiaceae bacterium]
MSNSLEAAVAHRYDLPIEKDGVRNSTLFAVALFLVGFVGYALRATDYLHAIPGDIGDARFNNIILEHLYLWTVGLQPHLWSPDFFYPNPGTLTFSDNHLGTAIFYVPFRILGLPREVAFDLWFLLGFVLNYCACYFVLQRLGFARVAAAAGAFVFTFALPMIAKEGHAQLLYRFAVPFAILALIEAWREKRLVHIWKIAVWLTVQFFCTIYVGVFLLYLLAATLIALIVLGERGTLAALINSLSREPRQHLLWASVVTALSLAALVWLLAPYLYYARFYGFKRPEAEIRTMLPRLGSYLLADRSPYTSFLGAWINGIPIRHEHQMFIGVGGLLLTIAGVIALSRKAVSGDKLLLGAIALLSLAILFAATVTIGKLSFYRLLIHVPGLSAIRGVSRIILVMLFPIALLSAIGVNWLMARIAWARAGLAWPAALAILALLGFEPATFSSLSVPFTTLHDRLENVHKALPTPLPRDAILWVRGTYKGLEYATSLDAMTYAQGKHIPTLNGYSGNAPPRTFQPKPCVTPTAQLAAWAHFSRMPAQQQAELSRRTITVSLSPCQTGELFLRDRPLPAEIARQIEVTIAGVQRSGNRILAAVAIRNSTAERLDTDAIDSRDLLLSWRIVPLSHEPAASKDVRWKARRELEASLAPGASLTTTVTVRTPKAPGDYALEFSIVEEHVRWLHDYGLVPARYLFHVPP